MSNKNNLKKIKIENIFGLIIFLGIAAMFLGVLVIGLFPKRISEVPIDLLDQQTRDKTAEIIKANDLKGCDSVDRVIEGVNYKTVCRNNIFYSLAQNNLDLNACDNLDNELLSRDDCKKLVILQMIQKEKNITVCNNLPENFKPLCTDAYWNFAAIEQKNPRLCEKTSTRILNSSCQNNLLMVWLSQGNSLDCSSFTDDSVKTDCQNFQKAQKDCSLIKNPVLQSFCSQKYQ